MKPDEELYNEKKEYAKTVETVENLNPQFADIINFLPDATFVIDTEGRVIAWNKAIEVMTKTKSSDILGKGNHEYSIPFYGFRRPVLVDLVLKPDIDIESEYKNLQRDGMSISGEVFMPAFGEKGSYIWAKAGPLYDPLGNLVGAIEAIRDITDRNRTEEALRGSESKFRQLFEQSADAMCLLEDHKFIDCNKAAMEMMKSSNKDEMLNIHPSQISPEMQPDGQISHEKAEEIIRTAFEREPTGSNGFFAGKTA